MSQPQYRGGGLNIPKGVFRTGHFFRLHGHSFTAAIAIINAFIVLRVPTSMLRLCAYVATFSLETLSVCRHIDTSTTADSDTDWATLYHSDPDFYAAEARRRLGKRKCGTKRRHQ